MAALAHSGVAASASGPAEFGATWETASSSSVAWDCGRELRVLRDAATRSRAEESAALRRSAEEVAASMRRSAEEAERCTMRRQMDEVTALQSFLSGFHESVEVRLERQRTHFASCLEALERRLEQSFEQQRSGRSREDVAREILEKTESSWESLAQSLDCSHSLSDNGASGGVARVATELRAFVERTAAVVVNKKFADAVEDEFVKVHVFTEFTQRVDSFRGDMRDLWETTSGISGLEESVLELKRCVEDVKLNVKSNGEEARTATEACNQQVTEMEKKLSAGMEQRLEDYAPRVSDLESNVHHLTDLLAQARETAATAEQKQVECAEQMQEQMQGLMQKQLQEQMREYGEQMQDHMRKYGEQMQVLREECDNNARKDDQARYDVLMQDHARYDVLMQEHAKQIQEHAEFMHVIREEVSTCYQRDVATVEFAMAHKSIQALRTRCDQETADMAAALKLTSDSLHEELDDHVKQTESCWRERAAELESHVNSETSELTITLCQVRDQVKDFAKTSQEGSDSAISEVDFKLRECLERVQTSVQASLQKLDASVDARFLQCRTGVESAEAKLASCEDCQSRAVQRADTATSRLVSELREMRQETADAEFRWRASIADNARALEGVSANCARLGSSLTELQQQGLCHDWSIPKCLQRLEYLSIKADSGLWLDSPEFSLGNFGPLVLRLYPRGVGIGDSQCAVGLHAVAKTVGQSALKAVPLHVDLGVNGFKRQTTAHVEDDGGTLWLSSGFGSLEALLGNGEDLSVFVQLHSASKWASLEKSEGNDGVSDRGVPTVQQPQPPQPLQPQPPQQGSSFRRCTATPERDSAITPALATAGAVPSSPSTMRATTDAVVMRPASDLHSSNPFSAAVLETALRASSSPGTDVRKEEAFGAGLHHRPGSAGSVRRPSRPTGSMPTASVIAAASSSSCPASPAPGNRTSWAHFGASSDTVGALEQASAAPDGRDSSWRRPNTGPLRPASSPGTAPELQELQDSSTAVAGRSGSRTPSMSPVNLNPFGTAPATTAARGGSSSSASERRRTSGAYSLTTAAANPFNV